MTEKYGEPWVKTGISDVSDTHAIDVNYRPEYASRIVACVNACAGLDLPDDVPAGALAALVEAASYTAYGDGTIGPGSLHGLRAALTALEVRK